MCSVKASILLRSLLSVPTTQIYRTTCEVQVAELGIALWLFHFRRRGIPSIGRSTGITFFSQNGLKAKG